MLIDKTVTSTHATESHWSGDEKGGSSRFTSSQKNTRTYFVMALHSLPEVLRLMNSKGAPHNSERLSDFRPVSQSLLFGYFVLGGSWEEATTMRRRAQ